MVRVLLQLLFGYKRLYDMYKTDKIFMLISIVIQVLQYCDLLTTLSLWYAGRVFLPSRMANLYRLFSGLIHCTKAYHVYYYIGYAI